MTISTSTFISVNTGITANDGTGDNLQAAFIKLNKNFGNIGTIGIAVANITVSGAVTINNSYVPTANTSTGTTGQVVWDSGHIYVCVATNSWRRANIAVW